MASHGIPPPLPPRKLPATRVPSAGINDEVIRRLVAAFNKQVSHVQAVSELPPHDGQFDLTRAPDEQFPPEKLQRTIERFYASVIAPAGNLLGHINRLRSWDDLNRTGVFCSVYAIAWLGDRLVLVVTVALLAMLFSPDVRSLLFPPLPKTQSRHGPGSEAQTQVKEEDVADLEFETAAEVSDTGDTSAEMLVLETADPEVVSTILVENASGKPRKKVHPALNRTMGALSDVTDICERLSNVVSPISPLDPIVPRLRLAGILVSICLVSSFCSSYMLVKTVELLIGLGLFGEPLFTRGMAYLHLNVPKWKEYMDIERTLLLNVPTNAQLTLTLLRLAESSSSPITLQTQSHSQSRALARRSENSAAALLQKIRTRRSQQAPPPLPPRRASTEQPGQQRALDSEDTRSIEPPKSQKAAKFFRFARRAVGTAVRGHIALDRALATTASGYARGLLTAVDDGVGGRGRVLALMPSFSGGRRVRADVFEAKFEGKRGCVVFDSPPGEGQGQVDGGGVLYFTTTKAKHLGDTRLRQQQPSGVVKFSIPLDSITGIRKTAGLGWKGKLIVELAVGSQDLGLGSDGGSADGLIIRAARSDTDRYGDGDSDGLGDAQDTQDAQEDMAEFHLTGVMGRDALFNRLVVAGGQRWEMC
ncbi:hypothetical protein BJY01DRAFT_251549 [Aspergillus pseudoustus]|uniref:Uncharacterized protein n=1 Tax=Aspergillus pseudoustus TaxID=1810923 RepID=A0ABR4JBV8_9EURO